MNDNTCKEDEKTRSLEEVCDETVFCFKTPEGHLYDYCKLNSNKKNRKIECSHRALSPDDTGYHPCFKYNPYLEQLSDEQGYHA